MAVLEDEDELSVLQQEFEWLLNEEVDVIMNQLRSIILECSRRFPVHIPDLELLVKSEKYHLTYTSLSQQDQVKVIATLNGDNISYADISLRLHKHGVPNHRTFIQNDVQWKLNQIQDASNHLMDALYTVSKPPLRFNNEENKFNFKTAEEVIQTINNVMSSLQKGRNSLIVPKKRTIEELQKSRNMKSIQPALPNDIAISFYVQSHKLICAVYHMWKDHHGQQKYDTLSSEVSVPFLSEALVLFTVALEVCQQLKDKISVFSQYKDMQVV